MNVQINTSHDDLGNKITAHLVNGVLHREDGPAVEYSNGIQVWYKNGKIHRDDGPAKIKPNGDCEWYQHGQLHREDGPARILNAGTWLEHWLHDERISVEQPQNPDLPKDEILEFLGIE